MYTMLQTSAGPVSVPQEVTLAMVEALLAAGWTVTGPSWRPSRRDTFTKVDAAGVTRAIQPMIQPHRGLVWRSGQKYFLDNSYGEYCTHPKELEEALATA